VPLRFLSCHPNLHQSAAFSHPLALLVLGGLNVGKGLRNESQDDATAPPKIGRCRLHLVSDESFDQPGHLLRNLKRGEVAFGMQTVRMKPRMRGGELFLQGPSRHMRF